MARSGQQKQFDAEAKAAFLEAVRDVGEVAPAAARIGFHRSTVYDHMAKDPDFKAEVDLATETLVDEALVTLKKLAITGVKETRYDKDGNKIAETMRYDTRALLKFLNRHKPREWGDKIEIDAKVEGTVTHAHRVEAKDIPRDARDSLRDALAKMPDNDPSLN